MNEIHAPDLHQMCLDHFNEPMLALDVLARCVGYGETGIDCYILADIPRQGRVWLTCVGGYTFLDRLKGQGYVRSNGGEDWDDLTRLDSSLTCMGCPPRDEFTLKLHHENMEDQCSITASRRAT